MILFYEVLVSKYGCMAIPLGYGQVNRGKTKAAEIALTAVGQPKVVYTSLTEGLVKQLLHNGLPFLMDDPSNTELLKGTLIKAFGSGFMGSARESHQARCTPIVCANKFIVESLADDEERLGLKTV